MYPRNLNYQGVEMKWSQSITKCFRVGGNSFLRFMEA